MSKTNPSHYTLPDGTQVYDITQHFDFTVGNCIKYLMRAGNKNGESSLDDLRKCKWYLDKLIEREEADALKQAEVTAVETSSTTDVLFSGLCPHSFWSGVRSWTD